MNIFAFADEASREVDRQIAAMVRNGLSGLEIRGVDDQNIAGISAEKAKEVRRKLDDAGLRVWSLGSAIGKIPADSDQFAEHLEDLKHLIELGNILGTDNIRMFSFFIPEGKKPEEYKNRVMDWMGQLLDTARGTGMNMCHENEKGIYGDIAVRCLELYQTFPELKGVFDPANFIQCGQETLEAWDMLHGYIKYMHIKDAMPDKSVVPAGKGVGHLPELLKMYRAQGGENVTIEPHLTVFEGLKDLERDGQASKVGGYAYASGDEAFDAACNALKALL